ncbi:MAG: efflux RND transporter periplasmic adaptor subunit [Chloroflexota bacterium]
MYYPTHPRSILALILLAALLLSGCSGLPQSPTPTVAPPDTGDLAPIVSATGEVTPAESSVLSVTAPGLIAEVLVKEGDAVEAGQVLVRLKGREELQAAIAGAKFETTAAQKAIDDLDDAADAARTQALQAISLYSKQLRDAQYNLDNYTVPLSLEDLDPWEAIDIMRAALDEARDVFEPYKFKSEGDATRKRLKEDLDDAQSDYNSAVRHLELLTARDVAQNNLDQARKDYETWKDGPDPAEVKVAQARLENADAALAAAQAALDDLELRALFTGVVSELYVDAGEWVNPGVPILQLADLQHLRVETTDLNEIDAARVSVGAPVKITFDALPDIVIAGTVKSLAVKPAQGSGVNYTAIIEMPEWPENLRWGMTAFVDITVP